MHLTTYDMAFAVRRLPTRLRNLMKEKDNIIVAGGYIRSIIANEPIADIDVFAGNKARSGELALLLAEDKKRLWKSDNAITVLNVKPTVQFIHRWLYEKPTDVLKSFDYTICQAAIWYDREAKKWSSTCSDRFYQDLAAKRLCYTCPIRNEDAGGSALRILKYYQRGYRIPLDSFGAVLARLFVAVRDSNELSEDEIGKIITGLLVEVDPNGKIDHEAYLPPEGEKDG